MKRIIAVILSVIAASSVAMAQDNVIFPSVEIDHNPATSAMGGASLLSEPVHGDFGASFQMWQPSSTSYISVGGAYKVAGKVTIRLDGSFGSGAAYDLRSGLGGSATSFSPKETVAHLGVGYRFIEKLGVEIGGRYISNGLAPDYSISGFSADVLLKGYLGACTLAAGVTNLGPSVEGCPLPSAIAFAVAYGSKFSELHSVKLELDAKYFLSAGIGASFGAEYGYNDMLFVRAGCHAGGVVAGHVSAGLGVKLSGVRLDASYLAGSGPVGNTMCFGLGYSF